MNTNTHATPIRVETAVKQRYTAAAKAPEAAICCPVEYDRRYPSTFVLDKNRVIRYAKISHSHDDRTKAIEILQAVQSAKK